MRSFVILAVVLLQLLCLPSFAQEEAQRNRVLVVLDNLAIRDTHSQFFSDLEGEGYNLDFKVLNHDNFKLQEYGEYLYDQIILFCTSIADSKYIKFEKFLEFFDSGNNLLVAGDIDTSKYFRQFANQLGVEFDQFGSKVYDDVRRASNLDNSLFFSDNQIPQPAVAPELRDGILYRGIGLTLAPYENTQLYAFLRGTEYTYSLGYDESSETEILNTGSKVVLVAGLQGRNNARAVVTGSLDMFSNELYGKSNGVNRQYANHLTKWNFGQSGILRVNRIFHHFANQDSSNQPGEYKVLDDIVYNIDITTWDASRKEWVPYVANDLYLEFVMLDPYIRMPLTQVPGTSLYRAEFKVPDKYGVFQFKVQYRKPGFSFIQEATKIPIRPFKHNEYERFLFEAFPYYITVFGTLAGFLVFVVFFLLDAPKAKRD